MAGKAFGPSGEANPARSGRVIASTGVIGFQVSYKDHDRSKT